MRYQSKTQNVDAIQWHKNGDHPHDESDMIVGTDNNLFLSEGKIVRHYRHPDVSGTNECKICGRIMHDHGFIERSNMIDDSLSIVCPGAYVETIAGRDPQTNQPRAPYKYRVWLEKKFESLHQCMQEPTVSELAAMLDDGRARFLWNVNINNKEYPVFSIESRHHWNGQANGSTDTWWIEWGGEVHPYTETRGFMNRIVHELNFRQYNTAKSKWDEMRTSAGIQCEIKANGKIIYSFVTGGSDFGFAVSKAQYMLVVLSEHPYDFYNPEKNNGRKIWWYNLPATVSVKSDGWEIAVIPDYTTMTKEEWWREYRRRQTKVDATAEEVKDDADFDHDEEYQEEDYINWGDAFSDQHIDWFRKDPPPADKGPSQGLAAG